MATTFATDAKASHRAFISWIAGMALSIGKPHVITYITKNHMLWQHMEVSDH